MWKSLGVSRSGYPQGLYREHKGTLVLVVPEYDSDLFVVADDAETYEYEVSFRDRNPLDRINSYLRKEGVPPISKTDFAKGFSVPGST